MPRPVREPTPEAVAAASGPATANPGTDPATDEDAEGLADSPRTKKEMERRRCTHWRFRRLQREQTG